MVVKIDLNTNRHSAGRDVDGDYRIVDSIEGGGESSVARLRRRQTVSYTHLTLPTILLV